MVDMKMVLLMSGLFWQEARLRVLGVAKYNGLTVSINEHDDDFLYDLYDGGCYIPTDEEIVEAINEMNGGKAW